MSAGLGNTGSPHLVPPVDRYLVLATLHTALFHQKLGLPVIPVGKLPPFLPAWSSNDRVPVRNVASQVMLTSNLRSLNCTQHDCAWPNPG
jgi:hypothetical protein